MRNILHRVDTGSPSYSALRTDAELAAAATTELADELSYQSTCEASQDATAVDPERVSVHQVRCKANCHLQNRANALRFSGDDRGGDRRPL
jgi:hypothetical protein